MIAPIRSRCSALLLAAALLTQPIQVGAQQSLILSVSPFMMPPLATWAQISPSADPNVVASDLIDGGVGFRVIHLRKSVQAKKQAAIDLARSGLVKTGDILLSFRPLWDKTLAYAHMQLGVSHSGLAFIVSDATGQFVMTLESPISYSSALNHPEHYADLDAIHVIRPTLSAAQVGNLERWARRVGLKQEKFEFFSDYSLPIYKRSVPDVKTPRDQVRFLAAILLGNDDRKFSSYCSEFVWSVLSLRDCDPDAFDQVCIRPPFSTPSGMMTGLIPFLAENSGLAQGPEASLTVGGIAAPDRTKTLTQQVFVDVLTDEAQLAGRMSAGHIQVAKANRDNMKAVNGYYVSGEAAAIAGEINRGITDNVSPTSYLVRSNAGQDGFQYVGTIVFDR